MAVSAVTVTATVGRILNRKRTEDGIQYEVEWATGDSTWEPLCHFPELFVLEKYHKETMKRDWKVLPAPSATTCGICPNKIEKGGLYVGRLTQPLRFHPACAIRAFPKSILHLEDFSFLREVLSEKEQKHMEEVWKENFRRPRKRRRKRATNFTSRKRTRVSPPDEKPHVSHLDDDSVIILSDTKQDHAVPSPSPPSARDIASFQPFVQPVRDDKKAADMNDETDSDSSMSDNREFSGPFSEEGGKAAWATHFDLVAVQSAVVSLQATLSDRMAALEAKVTQNRGGYRLQEVPTADLLAEVNRRVEGD